MTSSLAPHLYMCLAPGHPLQQKSDLNMETRWSHSLPLPHLEVTWKLLQGLHIILRRKPECFSSFGVRKCSDFLMSPFIPLDTLLRKVQVSAFFCVPKYTKYFSYAKVSHVMISLPAMLFPIPHMATFSNSSVFLLNLKSLLTIVYNIFGPPLNIFL